jgi:hypothetical protein
LPHSASGTQDASLLLDLAFPLANDNVRRCPMVLTFV